MAQSTDADAWGTSRFSWHCSGCGCDTWNITDEDSARDNAADHAMKCDVAAVNIVGHPL